MTDRIKQSIPIQGINTAEPCHTITDGYTKDIHNLRFRNGAFENVYEPKITTPISNNNGYTILHKMDCLPTQSYIALKNNTLYMVSIKEGIVDSVCSIGSVIDTDLKLHHFGNTLYANYKEDGQLVEKSWIYKDGVFVMFSLDSINPPTFDVSYTRKLAVNRGERPIFAGTLEEDIISGSLVLKRHMKDDNGVFIERLNEFEYGIDVNELQNEGYIVGDFIIMLAYRLFDGSIVKPSIPVYVSSYKPNRYPRSKDDDSLVRVRYQSVVNDTFEIFFYDKIRGVKPTITLTSNVVDNDIIKGVVILSTRAQCIYDYDNVHKKFATGGEVFRTPEYEEYVASQGNFWVEHLLEFNKISRNHIKDKMFTPIETPFYEIAEFEKEGNSITLNYDEHYKSITSQDVYKPSYSLHQIWSEGKYEYNNRLHCYGVNMKAFSGYALGAPLDLPNHYFGDSGSAVIVDVNFDVELTIDDEIYIVRQTGQALKYMLTALSYGIALVNPIIYPDARAKKIKVWGDGFSLDLFLIKNLSNNLAYYENRNSDHNFLDEYAIYFLSNSNQPPQTLTTSVSQTNKLYVSALNNPFFFAPANIYTIGSNGEAINSIETSMEQITETKFGLYPLNVFTNRAIYAMEVGNGDITYQRIIGLSNESKLPGTTTVGAGNIVFFIGEQGVMAIEGRHIYCISNEMEKYPALDINLCQFNDYIIQANLSYNPVLSELIVFNPKYDYTYVYSLTGKFWSRRDWDYKNISGSLYEIIIADKGIASAWKEDKTSPLRMCTLETRAIKLGSMEYKRVETLVARLSTGSSSYYEILLYGSNDLQKWTTIGKAEKTPMIRRTGASFKYFKLKIHCTVLDYFTITNFDTEFYPRFVHRLR